MIDDSDVMSLLIDEGNSRAFTPAPARVSIAATTVPPNGRRSRAFPTPRGAPTQSRRIPKHPASVYAATSEGLWKTADGGMTWRRTTPESWVVNTVVSREGDPGRVLIGTEELGVLASDDGGEHFQDANDRIRITGKFSRWDWTRNSPAASLAVLAHAPEPVLATEDDGRTWLPLGPGLRAEQVMRVYAAPDEAWWVSLARGGLMRYDAGKKTWRPAGKVVGEAAARWRPITGSGSPAVVGHGMPCPKSRRRDRTDPRGRP